MYYDVELDTIGTGRVEHGDKRRTAKLIKLTERLAAAATGQIAGGCGWLGGDEGSLPLAV